MCVPEAILAVFDIPMKTNEKFMVNRTTTIQNTIIIES